MDGAKQPTMNINDKFQHRAFKAVVKTDNHDVAENAIMDGLSWLGVNDDEYRMLWTKDHFNTSGQNHVAVIFIVPTEYMADLPTLVELGNAISINEVELRSVDA
jgi:hypothetical protein